MRCTTTRLNKPVVASSSDAEFFLNFPVKSPGSGTVIAIAEPNWVMLSTSSSDCESLLLLPLHQHVLSLRYVRVLFLVQNTVLK